MNCVLKYPGAKWGLAPWIIGFFPPHHSYLEPFFGSGGVLFKKSRSNIETINDLDGEVINLFECIKEDPERIARSIYFTPYAKAVYNRAFSKEPTTDRFARAEHLLIRCNMGHGFRTTGERVGWKNDVSARERAYAARAWADLPDIILEAAERLRQIEEKNRTNDEMWHRLAKLPGSICRFCTHYKGGSPKCDYNDCGGYGRWDWNGKTEA